jgi:hypothetical protein
MAPPLSNKGGGGAFSKGDTVLVIQESFLKKNWAKGRTSKCDILLIENSSPEDLLPPLESVGILPYNKYEMQRMDKFHNLRPSLWWF